MADRPRKSLAEKRADKVTPATTPSKTWSWLGLGRQKAVDASAKLRKFSSQAGRSAKQVAARSRSRSKSYVKDFFKNAPRGKLNRFIWWLHPSRQTKFWFNKNGVLIFGKLAALGCVALVLLSGLLYAYYARDLRRIDPRNLDFVEATKFYDRTGQTLLYSIYGDENRTVVEFDQISDYAKHATVAIEDKNFYHHIGLSPTGILRAAVNNLRNKSTQGGSTITQQYVKNALLKTKERSFERKIKEAILALEMERFYTKDEILGFYLNQIPYGGTSYGIEAAAQGFFSKSAKDLTIEEAAMLAALPQAPTYYSPYGEHAEELIGRAHYIIDLMREQGYITKDQAEAAKAVDTLAKVNHDFRAYKNIKAPYLVLEVQERLESMYGAEFVATAGWTIITTVDLDLQAKAEKAVADNIGAIRRDGGDMAAIVASDPNTSQVWAAVGGPDFNNPKFGRYNGAFTALRQPGSSIKPYTYATLMKGNYGAGSVLYDLRTDFGGGYKPEDADNRTKGALPIRSALAESRNITAVKALYIAGLENVFQTWRDVGIKSSDLDPAKHGLAFGLGTAEIKLSEHVNGFESFATGGIHREQALWLKITNKEGAVVDEWKDNGGKRVFDKQIAYIISSILSDKKAKLPLLGSRLNQYLQVPGVQLATKTGTTQSRRDAWTLGYSTCWSIGVWVGHHANKPMERYSILMAGPTFKEFATAAHEGKECKEFKKPSGIKNVTLDKYTGRLPDDATGGSRVTDIFPSWYKPADSGGGDKFTIDIVSGKLATDCTPEGARKEVTVGGVDAEIPPSDPSYHRWSPPVRAYAASIGRVGGISGKPTENDDAHSCSDAKPKITDFKVEAQLGGKYKFTATVEQGKFTLKQLDFKVDGQIVSGGAIAVSSNGTYSVTASASGETASAVLTDEGYYVVQEDEAMPAVLGSESLSIKSAKVTGPNTKFSWENNSGTVTIYRASDNAVLCSGSNGDDDDCQTALVNAPPGTSVYAKDTSGHTSPAVNVSA